MVANPALLVFQGHDQLRYLLSFNPELPTTIVITNAQLQADALSGPLRAIARAKTDGIGVIPAGTPLTQDQARDILCADGSGASVGNKNAPRAKLQLTPRSGFASVDANVDVDGNPTIEITISVFTEVYIDVIDLGGIGTV